eukprot:scaffold11900_cov176-Amphora_coffeaeformis.AAC.1
MNHDDDYDDGQQQHQHQPTSLSSTTSLSSWLHPWGHLKFWSGLLILLDIFVTLMGLVTTFTLWCMILAISDTNAHCILRSSLGQYAICLPPRLVVGSLYIFLLWMLLFVLELVAHPLSWIFVAAVVVAFLGAIILPLSALGRLILHTGAMAARPILAPELEEQLLPSGLYSSLLLRAIHRQRRNPHDVARQYRSTGGVEAVQAAEIATAVAHAQTPQEDVSSIDEETGHTTNVEVIPREKEPAQNRTTTNVSDIDTRVVGPKDSQRNITRTKKLHRRFQSTDTFVSECPLPLASVLNAAITSQELLTLMQTTINPSTRRRSDSHFHLMVDEHDNDPRPEQYDTEQGNTTSPHTQSSDIHNVVAATTTPNTISVDRSGIPPRPPALSTMRHHHHRSSSSNALLWNEWTEDADVRDLYGAAMPADLPPEEISFLDNHNSKNNIMASFFLPENMRWWANHSNSSLGHLSEDEVEPSEDMRPSAAASTDGALSHNAGNGLTEPLLSRTRLGAEEKESPPTTIHNRRERFRNTSSRVEVVGGDDDHQSLGSLRGEHLLS